MQTQFTIINPRTHEITDIEAQDWQTACRKSGVPDGCVLYPEADGRFTAMFLNVSGTPFGIIAENAERALAWVVQHQDACRAADERNRQRDAEEGRA